MSDAQPMTDRSRRRVTWAAVAGSIVSCVFVPGGLLSSGWPGDVIYYSRIGERIAHGQIPYHEFYLEYPPGSIPVFALPSLVSQGHYVLVFKLLMTACAAAAVWLALQTARRAGASRLDYVRAAVVLAVAPLALGPLFLNRYDAWPALLVAAALLALVLERSKTAFGILSVAVVAKIYPLAAVVVAAVHVLRTRGRDGLLRASAVFVAVALVLILPLAAVGFGGLGFSFYIQATRHLQIESLGAQLLIAAHQLGLYQTHVIVGQPGSFDLPGVLADAVGFLSSIVEVIAVAFAALLYARGRIAPPRLVLASALAVVAFATFGKVLSPQYMVWLVPIVPIVRGRTGAIASALLLVALVMTQLEFYDSDHVADLRAISWLVLARNLVLVALFATLARELARDPQA